MGHPGQDSGKGDGCEKRFHASPFCVSGARQRCLPLLSRFKPSKDLLFRAKRLSLAAKSVALAKELHGQGLSLRKVAAVLAERGHVTTGNLPHSPNAIMKMLASGAPRL